MRKTTKIQVCLSFGVANKLKRIAEMNKASVKEWITGVIMNWEVYDAAIKKPFKMEEK